MTLLPAGLMAVVPQVIEAAAASMASIRNRPVEIVARRTETGATFTSPNGVTARRTYVQPPSVDSHPSEHALESRLDDPPGRRLRGRCAGRLSAVVPAVQSHSAAMVTAEPVDIGRKRSS